MNEVFLVNKISENLSDYTRTGYCMGVFSSIEGANDYINTIKDRASRGDTIAITSYIGYGATTEPVYDETYDIPHTYTCRKVVYRWTCPLTLKEMQAILEIEQRQVF